MDGDLILIFAFVLTIATMALTMGHIFHRRTIKHEERKLELLARAEEAKSGRGASGEAYQKLEERVRVLERIATDKGTDLAQQIEHLRDVDAIAELTDRREKVQ